jgi:hypothetical protein
MTRTTNEFICDMSPEEYEDATLKAELMTLADIDAVWLDVFHPGCYGTQTHNHNDEYRYLEVY